MLTVTALIHQNKIDLANQLTTGDVAKYVCVLLERHQCVSSLSFAFPHAPNSVPDGQRALESKSWVACDVQSRGSRQFATFNVCSYAMVSASFNIELCSDDAAKNITYYTIIDGG